jgi:hypothetical protein
MSLLNWEIDQVDIVVAYLNSTQDEEIFMEAPPSLLKPGENDKV